MQDSSDWSQLGRSCNQSAGAAERVPHFLTFRLDTVDTGNNSSIKR